jgi:hypothetical protein
MLAQLNLYLYLTGVSQIWSEADLTGEPCALHPFYLPQTSNIFFDLNALVIERCAFGLFRKSTQETTLYIKEEKENTSTSSIEKNIYRVDKKITS